MNFDFMRKITESLGFYKEEDKPEMDGGEELRDEDSKVVPIFGRHSQPETSYEESRREVPPVENRNNDADKVMSMPVNRNPVSVVVIEPIDFNDSQKMADYLCKNQPVVINFEDTDPDVRKRIVDFVSGTIYALDGTVKKIGRNILVCAPPNIDIDTENTNYVEEEGNSPWEQ
ncbi:cell division protein SepF [Acidaminococcus sp. NSJ-142]|jgi:cell division inhibitor SepF|uniref:cell division protein SepF n=2 Tax=Acidaminococcus TaxID=904 RepID=UPI001E4D7E10|nr:MULTISPECIES: cell division protein SepF [Acidaminococcus]MCD2435471.1 cell division protein SepF [Acidaminococcus hominis]